MKTPSERFNAKYRVNEATGCWEWTASLLSTGYGQFRSGGRGSKMYKAHRYAYEAYIGPIPDGLQLDHLCRNSRCVNPHHLEPVTALENTARSELTAAYKNRAKTHCPQGHEYTPENVYINPAGSRVCRTCLNANSKLWHARHPEYDAEWRRRKKAKALAS
jgi:HNH endonuclease